MSHPIEETFRGVEEYISEANEIIKRGDYVELDGLESRVKTLCDTIAAMEKSDAQTHKNTLDRLMNDLEALQTNLLSSRETLKEELTGVQTHSAANHAYRKSGALTPKDE